MVLINKAIKEMTVKIVYYGPGLCGKTTNLKFIHEKANPGRRGKLLSIATETDRTLFFDLLPLDLGSVRGMKVRVQLYTVPGQVFYDATRRLVLRGADGVVFVADSQTAMMEANIESIKNLQENLIKNNVDPQKIPLVLQFNKRDLPETMSSGEMNNILRYRIDTPYTEACALTGEGVHETLKAIVSQVIKSVNAGVTFELDPGAKPAVGLGPGAKKPTAPPAVDKAAAKAKAEESPFEDEPDELPEELPEVSEQEADEALETLDEVDEEVADESQPSSDLPPSDSVPFDEEKIKELIVNTQRQMAILENALQSLRETQKQLEKLLKH